MSASRGAGDCFKVALDRPELQQLSLPAEIFFRLWPAQFPFERPVSGLGLFDRLNVLGNS